MKFFYSWFVKISDLCNTFANNKNFRMKHTTKVKILGGVFNLAKKMDKAMKSVKKGVAQMVDSAKETAEKAADKTADFIKGRNR